MSQPNGIAFFGGQGSKSLFSETDTLRRLDATASSHAVDLLLSSCHSAILGELLHFKNSGKAPAWTIDMEICFQTPTDILSVPNHLRNNPIAEGIVLCIQQLVDFLMINEMRPHDTTWTGIAGFCSGSIPAVAAACSRSVPEYICQSKEATRLAFWVGLRAEELAAELGGEDWQQQPWSLAITGVNKDKVEFLVKKFNAEVLKTETRMALKISTVSAAESVAIVGKPHLLAEFRSHYLPEHASSRSIQVYALYHGGEQAFSALHNVLRDIETRRISLGPPFSDLKMPLWSSQDGTIALPGLGTPYYLLEYILRGILVDTAHWTLTWSNILQLASTYDGIKLSVTGVGPGAHQFLMGSYRSLDEEEKETLEIFPPFQRPPGQCRDDGFAIIGMSLKFPLGLDKEQLWKSLENGLNSVQEIPASRFEIRPQNFKSNGELKESRPISVMANLLDESPFDFDHEFFNISPREATSMDPQQKLVLQGAKLALDDAGYVPNSTLSSQCATTACYIGAATDDYVQNLSSHVDVHYATSTLRAFLSGKISYAFDFGGPSMTIDAACSSSIVAITQACRALKNGDCSMALAGGVNAITSPNMHLGLARAGFLTPSGQCKSFDRDADGYSRAEGCGIFVLKRLRDAVNDKDRIHGVIAAAEINQCGTSRSITHPDLKSQVKLYEKLLKKSNLDPESISVVETHGTGTQAGDTTEIASLLAVFGRQCGSQPPLYLTSIKANIGHAEAASGAAGLGKLLLMLRHCKIPRQISLRNINPRFPNLADSNVHIPTVVMDWPHQAGQLRRALLNNFGAAGSNAALVVEESSMWRRSKTHSAAKFRAAYNFNVTAKRQAGVHEYCSAYLKLLKSGMEIELEDICYTATARRQVYDYGLSLVCESIADLIQQLEKDQIPTLCAPRILRPIIFVFSGQGCFYAGMSKSLLGTSPVFQDTLRQCDAILALHNYPTSTISMIQNEYSPRTAAEDIIHAQVLCFCVEYALACMWMSWNVKPVMVIGHSLGEYAALAISGALSLQHALHLVAHRAHLMLSCCDIGSSGMLACQVPASQLETLFESNPENLSGLSIACRNGEMNSVVAGSIAGINSLTQILKSQGRRCQKLDVALGFHSSALDPIKDPLQRFCADNIEISVPNIPTGSSYYGRLLKPGDLSAGYFSDQTRGTVQFSDLIRSISSNTSFCDGIFIETGPSASTLPLVESSLSETATKCLFLPTLRRRVDPWVSICRSLQALSRAIPKEVINWRGVWSGSDARLIDGPNYPFQQSARYIPYNSQGSQSQDALAAPSITSPLSSFYNLKSTNDRRRDLSSRCFETEMGSIEGYVNGHSVGGLPLCPASLYHGMILEAHIIGPKLASDRHVVLQDVSFSRPLLVSAETAKSTIIALNIENIPVYDGNEDFARPPVQRFSFSSSHRGHESIVTEHCSGSLFHESAVQRDDYLADKATGVLKQAFYRKSQQYSNNVFQKNMIYNVLFPRVVAYSERYHSIQELTVPEGKLEGWGTFRLPGDEQVCRSKGAISPVFMDTLLHAAGFIANLQVASPEACICAAIETLRLSHVDLQTSDNFYIYCRLRDHRKSNFFLAESYAMRNDGVIVAAVEGMRFNVLNLELFQAHLAISRDKAMTKQRVSKNTVHESRVQIQASVEEVVAQVVELPLGSVGEDTRLADIGIDSMMQFELCNALQTRFSLHEFDINILKDGMTIRDLQQQVVLLCHACIEPPGLKVLQTRDDSSRKDLNTIFSELTGISKDKIMPDATLESLGIDSLLSLELQKILTVQYGQHVVDGDLLDSDISVEQLGCLITERVSMQKEDAEAQAVSAKEPTEDGGKNFGRTGKDESNPVRIILLQSGSSERPPLFLFHDGSGVVDAYRKLGPFGSNVFGIPNPQIGFKDHHHAASSLVKMARRYASAIAAFPGEEIVLGGWSFGGVLAHEVAQHLSSSEKTVLGVILIDSPFPVDHEPLPSRVIDYIVNLGTGHRSKNPNGSNATSCREAPSIIASQFRYHAHLLSEYKPRIMTPTTMTGAKYVMLHCQDNFDTLSHCGIEYPELSDAEARWNSTLRWSKLLGQQATILTIPGNHFEPFTPSRVVITTEQLQKAYYHILPGKKD